MFLFLSGYLRIRYLPVRSDRSRHHFGVSSHRHVSMGPDLGSRRARITYRCWSTDLYPRLPSPEDGWRALAQAPFVTDILKAPIITAASTRSNLHSDIRHTMRWDDAYKGKVSIDTEMGFSVTDPLNTLFTMTRNVSQSDLVLAMYEFCITCCAAS